MVTFIAAGMPESQPPVEIATHPCPEGVKILAKVGTTQIIIAVFVSKTGKLHLKDLSVGAAKILRQAGVILSGDPEEEEDVYIQTEEDQ